MAEEKETEQKIQQLQLYEQSVQNILLQKQQFQSQISEIDSALKELETATASYRIIGNIMVNADKKNISLIIKLRLIYIGQYSIFSLQKTNFVFSR